MTNFPKLTIKNTSPVAHNAKIWLNDIEITEWCTRVTLDLQMNRVNSVTLQMKANEVDVDIDQTALDLLISDKVQSEAKASVLE